MTTRRVFLGGALAAASALTLPGLARAQSAKIRTKDGTELFVKDTGGTGRAVVMTHAWPLDADVW
ncbi:MAG TPA: alpha/beta hydrolase, partial [Xanthobacteraceae bacterium]|nr:alpha/beta hydrolase [Xanthobacteraceae bacterium]